MTFHQKLETKERVFVAIYCLVYEHIQLINHHIKNEGEFVPVKLTF